MKKTISVMVITLALLGGPIAAAFAGCDCAPCNCAGECSCAQCSK